MAIREADCPALAELGETKRRKGEIRHSSRMTCSFGECVGERCTLYQDYRNKLVVVVELPEEEALQSVS